MGANYSRMDQIIFSKGCLPQILLGLFLNTLSQLLYFSANREISESGFAFFTIPVFNQEMFFQMTMNDML